MKLSGVKNPRVAVQALNPHAEFGTEEKDEIIPAIELAKSLGINADGPLPCDTSFITAFKNKNYDCIVGMYHDALQSGLKAFGFDRGVTVQGGLPVPITTPAHGTAFDIAGKNEANLEPTLNSFKIALTMAENKSNELKLKISKLLFINGKVKLFLLKNNFCTNASDVLYEKSDAMGSFRFHEWLVCEIETDDGSYWNR